MGGLISLDVDLQSEAAELEQILAKGTGHFDFAGQLQNIKAGLIDLWAVNLITSILANTDANASRINCAIGRWTATEGILKADTFVIDTTRIRICGKGTVDFQQNQVDLVIAPTAKREEFFSLATPMEVHGPFDDIGLGVAAGGVMGTAARFITSPLRVPLKWMLAQEIPEDGSDVCSLPLGGTDRQPTEVKGCR